MAMIKVKWSILDDVTVAKVLTVISTLATVLKVTYLKTNPIRYFDIIFLSFLVPIPYTLTN